MIDDGFEDQFLLSTVFFMRLMAFMVKIIKEESREGLFQPKVDKNILVFSAPLRPCGKKN
jgi:hypothetical protein